MIRVFILTAALGAAGTAAAQETQSLGEFNDWAAYTYQENGKPVCYAASQPVATRGNVKDRGDAFVLVTNRAADRTWGEVSVVAGYDYRKGSTPTATIGGERFEMFTRGDTAWVRDEDDPKLVAAMKRGLEMTVSASAARGGTTTDTYSLRGFTKAMEAADKACGRK